MATTAEDALRAFIATKQVPEVRRLRPTGVESTVVDRGYVAMSLPDGSIAFVATVEAGVTLVHAVPAGAGWTIDRWEATGC